MLQRADMPYAGRTAGVQFKFVVAVREWDTWFAALQPRAKDIREKRDIAAFRVLYGGTNEEKLRSLIAGEAHGHRCGKTWIAGDRTGGLWFHPYSFRSPEALAQTALGGV